MNHAAAKNLQPVRIAAFIMRAGCEGNVDFCRRFREWEVACAETDLRIRAEKIFQEDFQCAFQISEFDALIDDEPFDLI